MPDGRVYVHPGWRFNPGEDRRDVKVRRVCAAGLSDSGAMIAWRFAVETSVHINSLTSPAEAAPPSEPAKHHQAGP